MPKIKTFTIKALVKSGETGPYAELDYESKVEDAEKPAFHFDEKDIAKYAQEVAEFNNIEKSSIEQMGPQDEPYIIDFKLIV